MEDISQSVAANEGDADRVRRNTSAEVNARLDREKYALKALRGDIEGVASPSGEGAAASRPLEADGA